MSTDRMVLMFAGLMILVSAVLAVTISAKFLLLTGFVGLNLFQSSFTGFCPLAKILNRRASCHTGPLFR